MSNYEVLRCPSLLWICILIVLSMPTASWPCTSFYLNDELGPIVGANLDWHISNGLIIINKRNFKKTAISSPAKEHNPISWTSRYGSITFNMYGIDWPWCGMNESGLVISSMHLQQTQYPLPDERPSIHMGQWLQYQLDNYSTVKELIRNVDRIRIRPVKNRYGTHYFVCDRFGNTAIIEYINGVVTYYSNDRMPIPVLTNEPYQISLNIVDNFNGFGGKFPIPDYNLSYCRFMRAATLLNQASIVNSSSGIEYAFEILKKVSYKKHPSTRTQWSIVFDIKSRQISFRTFENPNIRCINLSDFEFSCTTLPMMTDMHSQVQKYSIKDFSGFDSKLNRERFELICKTLPLSIRSVETKLVRLSQYPETFICQD